MRAPGGGCLYVYLLAGGCGSARGDRAGETVTLAGCALFQDGQCRGFLEQELVPGLMLLTGETKTAQIPVQASRSSPWRGRSVS